MTTRTHDITLSALFMALGILFPILFHTVGLGSVILPMFWPIAACAFFVPPSFALMVGTLTPLLSTMATGMPPPPTLYKMIFELAALAGCTALLYRRTLWGVFWLVLAGLIISKLAAILSAVIIGPMLGLPPAFYAIASLIKGLPGTVLILFIIPLLVHRLTKEPLWKTRNLHV